VTQAHERGSHPPTGTFLNLPNILSLMRIPLGVVFLAVDDMAWRAGVVAVGAATDLLDGYLARKMGTATEIGAMLDPFCDRIFVFLGLVSFLPTDRLDWAGFLILILRDTYTGGVFLVGLLAGRQMPFHSRLGGKITTALQVLALFALIFAPQFVKPAILLVGVFSVYAIIDYGMTGIRKAGREGAAG
jgi:phosphatidylglycerophosphate synthase